VSRAGQVDGNYDGNAVFEVPIEATPLEARAVR
jgi:hypothetical protein